MLVQTMYRSAVMSNINVQHSQTGLCMFAALNILIWLQAARNVSIFARRLVFHVLLLE